MLVTSGRHTAPAPRVAAALVAVAAFAAAPVFAQDAPAGPTVTRESQICVMCHKSKSAGGVGVSPAVFDQWAMSAHAANGVGCTECHGVPPADDPDPATNPRYLVETVWDQATGLKTITPVLVDGKPVERPDLWEHAGQTIVVNVSPRTCARCHPQESAEFQNSRHSSAAQFIGSIENFLGRYVEGPAAANSGCQQCHGSAVRIADLQPDNTGNHYYAPDTWPNTGVGRANTDGSWGSCTACHSRHEFSVSLARKPDNCGRCHMGPDHPQKEIFYESKHGVAYTAFEDRMAFDKPGGEWVVGIDYTQAPTCVTCHMGATSAHGSYEALPFSHDVGQRISWQLRGQTSTKRPSIVDAGGAVLLPDPEKRRNNMKSACLVCHSEPWVNAFYTQFDQAVEMYNDKYAAPLHAINQALLDTGVIDHVPMNEKMDFIVYELWHHEGRRARHGAAMMGPDYVQWHGFYEMSRHFYTEFLPLARELAEKAGATEAIEAAIDAALRGPDGTDYDRYHRWTEGLSPEDRDAMLKWEREAYGGAAGAATGTAGTTTTAPGGTTPPPVDIKVEY